MGYTTSMGSHGPSLPPPYRWPLLCIDNCRGNRDDAFRLACNEGDLDIGSQI